MLDISFGDDRLDYNGSGFFTRNSNVMALGSHGKKADSILGVGKLERKDTLPPKWLTGLVRSGGSMTLNSVATSKAKFTASVAGNIQAVGFEGSAGAIYDALAAAKLKFVQLYVDEADVVKVVNAHPQVRDTIHDYGADGRIVNTVFIAMAARTADAFGKGAKVTLDLDVLGVLSASVGTGSGSSQTTTVTLSPNTCIAYGLLKLEWSSREDCFNGSHVDEPGMK